MKLQIKITESKEIEIYFPLFTKSNNMFTGMIDEENIITLLHTESFKAIQAGTAENFGIRIQYAVNEEKITEEEFFEKYNAVLESLSLIPTLKS